MAGREKRAYTGNKDEYASGRGGRGLEARSLRMKKVHMGVSIPSLLLTWMREALPFLLKQEMPHHAIRRTRGRADQGQGEIGMICQFVGDIEGEMTLLASRKTAFALAAALAPHPPVDDEIQLLKCSLGELTNVLMSKLLARYKEYYRVLRVTTPSCIYGGNLVIEPSAEETSVTAFETPFGRLDIIISLRAPNP
jgi:CheY-specific phosphatase CheX